MKTDRTIRAGAHLGRLQSIDRRASIDVWLYDAPFSLAQITKSAPTGVEVPPEPIRFGGTTFYYYGPGGGGIGYPDRYYSNLNGRTLEIRFEGPYGNNKTPQEATKQLEPTILRSFRSY